MPPSQFATPLSESRTHRRGIFQATGFGNVIEASRPLSHENRVIKFNGMKMDCICSSFSAAVNIIPAGSNLMAADVLFCARGGKRASEMRRQQLRTVR